MTRRAPHGTRFFSDDRSEFGAELVRQMPQCEIVNLHLVAGLRRYPEFLPTCHDGSPLVWTLHDPTLSPGGATLRRCRPFQRWLRRLP